MWILICAHAQQVERSSGVNQFENIIFLWWFLRRRYKILVHVCVCVCVVWYLFRADGDFL